MFPNPVHFHTARRFGLALLAMAAPYVDAQIVAFPGAEGFGRFASGGRGGDVYIVTNLNDSGPGSFREGVTNRNEAVPRTVVFAVSGTIYLNSTLRITKGNLTIAGQTAPGDGICLAYYTLNPSNSNNVIIRFIRSRLGDVKEVEDDAFMCRYASNMIIDHCSFSWSVDETASAYDNTNFTMQWCLISESLRASVHSKGNHGYGGIWGGLGATFHHNLIAHHDSRNPRFNGAQTHGTDGEIVDMRNNVIYNWRGNTTYGGQPSNDGIQSRQNMINNYYKSGPATPSNSVVRYRILEPTKNETSTGPILSLFHIAGNHTTASAAVSADNWNGGVQKVTAQEMALIKVEEPFVVSPVITQSAVDCFPLVLEFAGCRVPARDSLDTRIVSEVANGTATYNGSVNNWPGIIDSQNDVGGWPALQSLPAPVDTDQDGMPDAWEIARGLNPNDPADRNLTNAEGYTNLELYLNELAASSFPVPEITLQPESGTVSAGAGFSLSVIASGPGPFAYQWYLGNDNIDGADEATYSVEAAALADTGDYHVVVVNGYGSTRSETAAVLFGDQAPVITGDPEARSVAAGQAVAFSVSVTGTQPISYQWFRGERPLPGATGATLDLGPATLEAAGPYHVVVTNPYGSQTSAAATLTVTSTTDTSMFSTGFASDTIHAATPLVTPTSTNWYVMSSKDARPSAIAASHLDLTMPITSSGIVEAAALFSNALVGPFADGEGIRVTVELETRNVRTLGIGLFDSGASLPHTGLINSGLTGGSSEFATGGTMEWAGCRFHLDSNNPVVVLEGRPPQPGTTNASQSLIVPGTSSSAPSVNPLGSIAAPEFIWNDESTHTLTLDLQRTDGESFALTATVHAGTDTAAHPLAGASAIGGSSVPAGSFDALAIGYRNRDAESVSRVRISRVSVERVGTLATISDPYEAFLFNHGLDPATTGAPGEDFEFDGVANSLEFILGGDPTRSDPAVLPALVIDDGGRFRFLRHIDASSVFDLEVEASSNLLSWDPLKDVVDDATITATPFSASHDQIEVLLPEMPAPSLFLRLTATPKP